MGVAAGVVVAATVAGLLGGGVVPFAAYRLSVPAGDPPRVACVLCGQSLPGGWLRVTAACGMCGTRWGPPSWLTVPIAAVACGLIAAALGPRPDLPLYLAVCLFGVLLGAIDAACKRLPHELVMPAIAASAVLLAGLAAVTTDWGALRGAALGSAGLGGVFLLLFLLPRQGLGLGDVKLAVLLGGYLGWIGGREVVLGAVLPWLVNGPVALALLLSGRAGRRSTLPFGPAMLIGALLAIVVGAWLDISGRAR